MRPSDDSHVVCCFGFFFAKEDCQCKQHSQSKKKKSFSSKFTNVYVLVELHYELIIIEIDMCSHIFFRKFNFLQTKINLFNFIPSLKLALLSSFKKKPTQFYSKSRVNHSFEWYKISMEQIFHRWNVYLYILYKFTCNNLILVPKVPVVICLLISWLISLGRH